MIFFFFFLLLLFSFDAQSFVEVPYKIETGEAERLAVNHVANLSDSGNPDESKRNNFFLTLFLLLSHCSVPP